MIFYSIFCVFNRKAEIWEKPLFPFLSSSQVVKKTMIMDYDYHLEGLLKRGKSSFSQISAFLLETKKIE